MKGTYYNENDAYAVRWLRSLIDRGHLPAGDVDDRSIKEVQPDDLKGYHQHHFFAGIGGWALAAELAGWDGPLWTGSCPCQPFSVAGKQRGADDPRHLWPDFFRLIAACRPVAVVGEQVASAAAWLDLVSRDLEGEGYTFGAVVLGAHSVGAPHQRQRFWWCGMVQPGRTRQLPVQGVQGRPAVEPAGAGDALADTDQHDVRAQPGGPDQAGEGGLVDPAAGAGLAVGNAAVQSQPAQRQGRDAGDTRYAVADSGDQRLDGNGAIGRTEGDLVQAAGGGLAAYHCHDGKYRPIPLEPELCPVADGLPESVDGLGPVSRTGTIKGAGNAIVPQVGAFFLKAVLDERDQEEL